MRYHDVPVFQTVADLDRHIDAQATKGTVERTDCGACYGYRLRDGRSITGYATPEEFRARTLRSLHGIMEMFHVFDVAIRGEDRVQRFTAAVAEPSALIV